MNQYIEDTINDAVKKYKPADGISWLEPLVAYARADDPLFDKLKTIVGPTHSLPKDFLQDAQTVITYFIPFSQEIIDSNLVGRFSSQMWAIAYMETNRLIGTVNKSLQDSLNRQGHKTVFVPTTHNFNKKTLLSDWSHRSAAYIAGLGTFGLNNMLITKKGCCGRIGSLVTSLMVSPTKRYNRELCIYKAGRSCGRCIEKCVNDALKIEGFDRHKCYEMCLVNNERLCGPDNIADVCGKCLVGLPCSTTVPAMA